MTVPVGKRYLRGLILSCLDHCVRLSLKVSCMWNLKCLTIKANLQRFAGLDVSVRMIEDRTHQWHQKETEARERLATESWYVAPKA